MDANGFRRLYDYHFSQNRRLWDHCTAHLTQSQYVQKLDYSVGSIRNQMVHMMNIDERWFCDLRGQEVPGLLNPVYFHRPAAIRERWDGVEADMRAYLAALQGADLEHPLEIGMQVWEVLFHVLNHGTDHRAQVLVMLHHLGVPTWPQDYAIFLRRRK